MQVDVGNNHIHSIASSLLRHPAAQSPPQSATKKERDSAVDERHRSIDSTGHKLSAPTRRPHRARKLSSKSSRERDKASVNSEGSHSSSDVTSAEESIPRQQWRHSHSSRRPHSHSRRRRKRHSERRPSALSADLPGKRTSLSLPRSRDAPQGKSPRPPPYPTAPSLPPARKEDSVKERRSRRLSAAAAAAATPTHAKGEESASFSGESRSGRPSAHRRRDMSHSGKPMAAPSNGRSRQREDVDAVARHQQDEANGSGDEGNEKENRRKDASPAQKPGPKLAQTKIRLGMRLKRWMIVSRIGAGSFGETFTAIEIDGLLAPLDPEDDPLTITPDAETLLANLPEEAARNEVCIKVEQENKNVLRLEALALKKVQPCPQVVRYLGSGCTCGMNFLVMEKLGPNLAELRRRSPHGTFNIYTTLKAGISCLQAVRGVHEQGLVHRDIKPSNFVTGLPGSEDQATCFIIDFGLARRYRRSNGEIRPARENAGFRGTSRYASVTSHHHQELGRVDDLWSLLFMLVEFATGTLPWRKYKDKDDIGRCKEESITPHLVRNLPREFQPFLAHLQTLRYEDEPDYDLLLALMHRSLERRGYPRDKPVDWELDPSMIEAADGELGVQQPQPQPQPGKALNLPNGGAFGGGDGAAGENAAGGSRPFTPGDAYGNNRTTPGRVSSSQPIQRPPANGTKDRRQQQLAGNGKGDSSASSEAGERERPHHSGNTLRVSEVEVSYSRSQQLPHDEGRSHLGVDGQQSALAGKHSAPQSQPPAMRFEDGSETPAAQASSSSRQAEAEGLDHENREFSPREQDDEAAAAAQSRLKQPSPAAAKPEKPANKSPDGIKAKVNDILSPSPPAVGGEQSLDAIEVNAINDLHPSPSQPNSRRPSQAGPQRPSTDKIPKVKSNCKCAVM